jgi:hypothetical protein
MTLLASDAQAERDMARIGFALPWILSQAPPGWHRRVRLILRRRSPSVMILPRMSGSFES